MSKEKRRVPKLRFPGFTEDWEQRKADYIFKSVTDKGYPELPVLSASQELGMVYRDQNGIDIQHDKKKETSYKRVLPGQFVIHLRSFQGGFAYSEIEGITSPAYTVMSFKNSSEQYGLFWKHVFKSETFIKRLETITYGIRDGRSISFSDFKSLLLQYPSFSEQKLIGDSIAVIERGITLHQRKLDNLKLKKKALLQKLFPKNGERYPELRFPGFTDAWEQRKADYIFKSVTDKGYPELPVLSASQELGMVYRDQNGIDIQHDKKKETSYKRVLPGQFVIHLRSFQGGFAYSEIEGITSPAYTVMSFKNSSEQYGLFWKHVFKSETFIKRLETITYGIRDGRSISFSDFKSLLLQYPSFSEQKLIGDSIAVIERGITLHQRKLDHLKLQKKALLQQMFV